MLSRTQPALATCTTFTLSTSLVSSTIKFATLDHIKFTYSLFTSNMPLSILGTKQAIKHLHLQPIHIRMTQIHLMRNVRYWLSMGKLFVCCTIKLYPILSLRKVTNMSLAGSYSREHGDDVKLWQHG